MGKLVHKIASGSNVYARPGVQSANVYGRFTLRAYIDRWHSCSKIMRRLLPNFSNETANHISGFMIDSSSEGKA